MLDSKPTPAEILLALADAQAAMRADTDLAIAGHMAADEALTQHIKRVNHLFYQLRLAQHAARTRAGQATPYQFQHTPPARRQEG